MPLKSHAFLLLVTPAKLGVQFEALKRKGVLVHDVETLIESSKTKLSPLKIKLFFDPCNQPGIARLS